jgi:hypothetical protein
MSRLRRLTRLPALGDAAGAYSERFGRHVTAHMLLARRPRRAATGATPSYTAARPRFPAKSTIPKSCRLPALGTLQSAFCIRARSGRIRIAKEPACHCDSTRVSLRCQYEFISTFVRLVRPPRFRGRGELGTEFLVRAMSVVRVWDRHLVRRTQYGVLGTWCWPVRCPPSGWRQSPARCDRFETTGIPGLAAGTPKSCVGPITAPRLPVED